MSLFFADDGSFDKTTKPNFREIKKRWLKEKVNHFASMKCALGFAIDALKSVDGEKRIKQLYDTLTKRIEKNKKELEKL